MAERPATATTGRLARVRRWARRRIIVSPGYQLRSLLPVGVFMGLYAALSAAFVFYPLHHGVSIEPDPGVQALLEEQLFSLHLRLWPLLLMAGLLAGAFALIHSHRVAGPLYRLEKVLAEMTAGEIKNVRFREGDEFREFEGLANQLGQKMKLLATRNRDALLTVQNRVKNLSVRLANEELPKVEVQEALEAVLSQLGKVLDAGAGKK